jgi:hypothetical protein
MPQCFSSLSAYAAIFGGRDRTRTGTPEDQEADFKSAVSTVPPRGLGASASSTAGARTSGFTERGLS